MEIRLEARQAVVKRLERHAAVGGGLVIASQLPDTLGAEPADSCSCSMTRIGFSTVPQ